jgi:hypothetical protein
MTFQLLRKDSAPWSKLVDRLKQSLKLTACILSAVVICKYPSRCIIQTVEHCDGYQWKLQLELGC